MRMRPVSALATILALLLTLGAPLAQEEAAPPPGGEPVPLVSDEEAPADSLQDEQPAPVEPDDGTAPEPDSDAAPAPEIDAEPAGDGDEESDDASTIFAEPEEAVPAAEPIFEDSPLVAEATVLLQTDDDAVYAALGNSVLRLDPVTGAAIWRVAMPGVVTHLDQRVQGVSAVSSLADGLSERLDISANGTPRSTVRFVVDPAVLDSLAAEALRGDPLARLNYDHTNPWLYVVMAGLTAGDSPDGAETAAAWLSRAVDAAATFHDLAGVARAAAAAGEFELADEAMRLALLDFDRRGYDPGLLTDLSVHELYNFPLQPLRAAVAARDWPMAAFAARWVHALSHPNVPELRDALAEYAASLAAAGEAEQAEDWLQASALEVSDLAVTGPERFFGRLGEAGWYMFAAIVAAILALQVTLTCKYWAPQSLTMRRTRETGGKPNPLQRFFAIRFFSMTEKLVLALLYASGLAVLGLAAWVERSGEPPAALTAGTLASSQALDELRGLGIAGERGEFIRGYAAHAAGSTTEALLHYRAAPRYGPAVNNLAVLTEDPDLFEEALRLSPRQVQIEYNLGLTGIRPPFEEALDLERQLLVAPSPLDFRVALRGTWQQAIGGVFANPWQAALLDSPFGGPQWLWQGLFGLYLALGVLTVLWLLVPRPRMARNAPRTVGYHVLAVLVPGSGMADEVWGVLLLVPWALFGMDLVSRLVGQGALLAVTQQTTVIVVVGLYLVNTAAFAVEYFSYRRRLRALFQGNPDAAAAYGRRPEMAIDRRPTL